MNDRNNARPAARLIAWLFAALLLSLPVKAVAGDNISYPTAFPGFPRADGNMKDKPPEKPVRAHTLDEMIQRSAYPSTVLQAVPLSSARLPELGQPCLDALSGNYFAVVDNTSFNRMSDIYRDNRLRGKSNYVTADSIIHPYIAFTNRVLADVAVKQERPDLALLLQAMQQAAIADYGRADDNEVREDIERNIAYLTVAIKILVPGSTVPKLGIVPKLVGGELSNIEAGKAAQSIIFQREEDFSRLQPVGWYNSSADLRSFYTCRQWLSWVGFPIEDTTFGNSGNHTNPFRRSVLLYRCLDNAQVLNKPALDTWKRLVRASALYGSTIEDWHERTLYLTDYKAALADRPNDLKILLSALAEPLFRTKLMLAIRRQKINSLHAASIFELASNTADESSNAVFRLFPVIAEPEVPWLRIVSNIYPTDKAAAESWPLGLLDAYAWGCPEAGNLLNDNMLSLDANIAAVLPELLYITKTHSKGGHSDQLDSRPWRLLSRYFRPITETTAPEVFRTETWGARRAMSAIAGWVDYQVSIAPDDGGKNSPTSTAPGTSRSTNQPATGHQDTASARIVTSSSYYHYLDPCPDIFKALQTDADSLQTDLESAHYFPESYRQRFKDFTRLFQRLQSIAELEIHGERLEPLDRQLLATIDLVLDSVDTPPAAVLSLQPDSTALPIGPQAIAGINLAIGRPALIYLMYQNPTKTAWWLSRGALYTYYEQPAPLLTDVMWRHKVEAGFARPPSWSSRFEIFQTEQQKQSAPLAKPPTAAARGTVP